MAGKPKAYYLAPTLLVLCTLLAVGNWYLRPERVWAWAWTLVLLGCMTVAFLRAPRRSENDVARRRAADSITSGIVFAGLIVAIPLSLRLAATLGAIDTADAARRLPMVMLGAFFVYTGNAIPKTLTPLSALQCDAARAQAFQRWFGWTWVLMGLAWAIVWLVLPLDLAKPVALVVLFSGILVVVAQMVRLNPRTGQ
jgi:hypothetical protein